MIVTIEKFEKSGKVHPVITLKRTADDKFPFTMGLMKCKMVIEGIEAIKKFVQENSGAGA